MCIHSINYSGAMENNTTLFTKVLYGKAGQREKQ